MYETMHVCMYILIMRDRMHVTDHLPEWHSLFDEAKDFFAVAEWNGVKQVGQQDEQCWCRTNVYSTQQRTINSYPC